MGAGAGTGRGGTSGGALAAAVLLALGAAGPAAAEWTARTGVHVDAWSGADQRGHQVLAPFGLAWDSPGWGASLRGAVGTSERDPGGGLPTGTVSGFTDTTLGGYARTELAGLEVRLGLDLDLPTGQAGLKTSDLAAVQDEDLALLERFGEGLDVNPTLSVYRGFGLFGLGAGVGYFHRGSYDSTRDFVNDDLDPGDELTAVILGDVLLGDAWRLLGQVGFTAYGADERGGRETFEEGDEVDLRAALEWRPEPWWVVVAVRDVIRTKADRLDASGRLATEPRSSRGNDFRGAVTVGYILDDVWSLALGVEVRHVWANDYPADDPLHDGGRTKVAVGPTVAWAPDRRFAVEGTARYFAMDVERSPVFPSPGTIHGVHLDLRLLYRF
jgi:hypothetical protein